MNALPSDEMVIARAAAERGLPSERALQSALSTPSVRQHLAILTAFWIYVAFSNVLYANSMQASLAMMPGEIHFFAPWGARLLQHLFLYPVLLGCVWVSNRVGWQPLWRKVPGQALLGFAFAVLGAPALMLGEYVTGNSETKAHVMSTGNAAFLHFFSRDDLPMWLASITTFLLTYGFGLALVMGFAFYKRLRDSQLRSAALERALSAAHLAALRMQLSPHTLFNLLHTIRGQIAWNPAAAQSMVVQLGDLLRRLLTAGEHDFSRLTDELQFVRLYLNLQQQRFADRLTVAVPEPDSLLAAWVPSLILQPLVENAVVHGLAGHEGAVTVRVEAVVTGELLSLRVVNSIAAGKPQGCAGIGLKNVRERLAIQFGERATFSAMPGYDNVWIAEVRLPLLRDGPAVPKRI